MGRREAPPNALQPFPFAKFSVCGGPLLKQTRIFKDGPCGRIASSP